MSVFQDDFHPNIPWERNIIFKMPFLEDMLVPWRVDPNKTSQHFHQVAIVQDHHRIPGFVKVDIASSLIAWGLVREPHLMAPMK